jgi:hypothetical protein
MVARILGKKRCVATSRWRATPSFPAKFPGLKKTDVHKKFGRTNPFSDTPVDGTLSEHGIRAFHGKLIKRAVT